MFRSYFDTKFSQANSYIWGKGFKNGQVKF